MKSRKKIKYLILILLLLTALIYNTITKSGKYEVEGDNELYLKSMEVVNIKDNGDKIKYDYLTNDSLVYAIFPDDKISYLAYASLAYEMSLSLESDVVVFNYNFLGNYNTLFLLDALNYEEIVVVAHGNSADLSSFYAHNKKIKALIYLGGVPLFKMPSTLPVLSIRGNLDGTLSEETWFKKRKLFSKDSSYVVIDKANFSGFAQIRTINNDNPALIDCFTQQKESIKAIKDFIIALE